METIVIYYLVVALAGDVPAVEGEKHDTFDKCVDAADTWVKANEGPRWAGCVEEDRMHLFLKNQQRIIDGHPA